MTASGPERRRYGRVAVSRQVAVGVVQGRELVKREVEMLEVGLGGCVLATVLPTGTQAAVAVVRDLVVVGRLMPGPDAGTSRVDWALDDEDAERIIAAYELPFE